MTPCASLRILIASGVLLVTGAAGEPLDLGYPTGLGLGEVSPGKPPPELAAAFEVVALAGLDVKWEPVPMERRFEFLKNARPNFCLPAVFKTTERESLGSFSEPYDSLPPFVIVSLASKAAEIERHGTASALLADDKLTLIRWGGFSYGDYLDSKIRSIANPVALIYSETADGVGMLESGRGDYAIIRKYSAIQYIERAGHSVSAYAFTSFPDIPQAEPLYFLCSKTISAEILDRINRAIERRRETHDPAATK